MLDDLPVLQRKMSAAAVPRSSGAVLRTLWVTTRSPSAIIRLISKRSSGNSPRYHRTNPMNASGPSAA
jgi:hypothetical protein